MSFGPFASLRVTPGDSHPAIVTRDRAPARPFPLYP